MLKKDSNAFINSIHMTAAFLCFVTLDASAQAGFVLNFGTVASPAPGSVSTSTIGVGESIDISIYLSESTGETRLADSGVATTGTKATFASTFGAVSDVVLNPSLRLFPVTEFDNAAGTMSLAGVEPSFNGIKGNSVLIGTFRFSATAPGDTTFKFGDFNPDLAVSDFSLHSPDFNFIDIDQALFGVDRLRTYDFTVQSITAVPEPSSFLLLLIGGVGFVYGARWTRKRERFA